MNRINPYNFWLGVSGCCLLFILVSFANSYSQDSYGLVSEVLDKVDSLLKENPLLVNKEDAKRRFPVFTRIMGRNPKMDENVDCAENPVDEFLCSQSEISRKIQVNEDLTVEEIEKNVIVATHHFPWAGNCLAVSVSPSELVLVDTPWELTGTEALLNWLQERFGLMKITAINTHFHQDNLGGNEILLSRGIPVYGSDLTVRLLEEKGDSVIQRTLKSLSESKYKRYFDVYKNMSLKPPDHVFELGKGLTLHIGEEDIEIFYPGPAHTFDNIVVYFPKRKILFGGCMIRSLESTGMSPPSDGDLGSWPESAKKVMERFPEARIVIPGHGMWGDIRLIQHTIDIANQSLRQTETVTDIDGNVYRTVKIGRQIWMVENLRVTHYRDGSPIPYGQAENQWSLLTNGGYYLDQNDPSAYKKTYGALYNFYAVSDSRGLSPEGWHVPTAEEWRELIEFLGGKDRAGGKMKDAGSNLWKIPNPGATNGSGFSALPAGGRGSQGSIGEIGYYATWWSSTVDDSTYAWHWGLYPDKNSIRYNPGHKASGFSVRCVKDK